MSIPPMRNKAELWPHYGADEIAAVAACLESGKVNQWTGPHVADFERAYAMYVGAGQAIALANGSLALELALRAFGIGPGEEVIVTPRSFVASASCVMLVGATPVFAEVDALSGNITAESILAVITPRTRAIIPVHLGGWPADMPAIMAVARQYGLKVVEDCAQAHGASIDGKPVGSFGDAAAFSFCQDKIITTGGEGGLVIFQDEAAFSWARSFKDHGKNFTAAMAPAEPGIFRWLHDNLGTNWRMTSIAAVIGEKQLCKLDNWRDIRERNAAIWASELSALEAIRVPWPGTDIRGAFYKFYCYVDRQGDEGEWFRDEIIQTALVAGLRVFAGSCSEIYREKLFKHLDIPPLPVARQLGRTSLMLEVHPTLDEQRLRDQAAGLCQVIDAVLR